MDPFSSLFVSNDLTANKCRHIEDTLPPEPQSGNVEYKLKIVDPTDRRFEHLVSQMKWRLQEGNGEAFYQIGVDDEGTLKGLTQEELDKTLQVLHRMADRLKADLTVLSKRKLSSNNRNIAKILVQKIVENTNNVEVRVAVLGNAYGGKSTLLGVLTKSCLDNGRGRARLNMLRHLHEIKTGRTSSISHEILGFDSDGNLINYGGDIFRTPEEICRESTKLVSFLDLAGHKKYMKTTIHGLSGYFPHYVMLIIPSNTGITDMTQEHLSITRALKVPFFFVVTKVDLVSPKNTITSLQDLLKEIGSKKMTFVIEDERDCVIAFDAKIAEAFIPVFMVSSVTGDGIGLLTKFLGLLTPTNVSKETKFLEEEQSPHFQIDEVFNSADAGQLVAGMVRRGSITEGQAMKIGPFSLGSFVNTKVESIHRNRVRVSLASAGQCVVLKLSVCQDDIRKGMVIMGKNVSPFSCYSFKAYVTVLQHTSSVRAGFETTVHMANIRQTASVVRVVGKEEIRPSECGCVLFKFKQYPEYVTPGQNLLFRSGFSKGVGEVTQVFPIFDVPNVQNS